jgi:hypothetical protein
VLIQPRTDNAELARDVRRTVTNALFARNVVEVYPLSVGRCNDTLCAENHSEFARHELVEAVLDLSEGEFIGSFNAPACEYVVSVMMTVMIVIVVMALALGIVALVVVVVVMLVLMAITFVIMVMMVMLVVMMLMLMMMVMTFTFGIVTFMLMLMMMVMTFAFRIVTFVLVMVMMPVLVVLVHKLVQTLLKRVLALCGGKYCLAVYLIPRSRNYRRVLVYGADYRGAFLQLVLFDTVGAREHDSRGVLYLIAVKFRKILHIHLALVRVDHRANSRKSKPFNARAFDRLYNVGELTDAGRLDNDPVGVKLGFDLSERLTEIADERAADATRIHLGDLNACFLKETAVDADLSELVLNKNNLFARISVLYKLFYKRGLSRAEKAGIYIYFSHNILQIVFPILYYTTF